MISDELKAIIEQLKALGRMDFFEGKTEEQIAQFEKEYDVSLPSKYKEWLTYSDGGECFLPAGVQFYGIAHKPIINVNDGDRPNEKYIVIGALSTGDPILCEKDSEAISIYNHEAGVIEEDEVYEDFYAFLRDLPDLLGIMAISSFTASPQALERPARSSTRSSWRRATGQRTGRQRPRMPKRRWSRSCLPSGRRSARRRTVSVQKCGPHTRWPVT